MPIISRDGEIFISHLFIMINMVVLLYLIAIFFVSCSTKFSVPFPAKFEAKLPESHTIITLFQEEMFTYEQINLGIKRRCEGSWKIENNNMIKIACDDQSQYIEKVLSSGYMEPIELSLVIMNKNTLKDGSTVYKRTRN